MANHTSSSHSPFADPLSGTNVWEGEASLNPFPLTVPTAPSIDVSTSPQPPLIQDQFSKENGNTINGQSAHSTPQPAMTDAVVESGHQIHTLAGGNQPPEGSATITTTNTPVASVEDFPLSLASERKRSLLYSSSRSSSSLIRTSDICGSAPTGTDPLAEHITAIDSSPSTNPSLAHQHPSGLPNIPPFSSVTLFTNVTLSNPQKIENVVTPYVVYKVDCMASTHPHSVLRRYRDFDALYQTLVCTYPGVIVPPIPEKAVLGRFADDFVEHRRLALEQCLQQICAHPILKVDSNLAEFLQHEKFDIKKLTLSAKPGVEADPALEARYQDIKAYETQLKSLHKVLESINKQRKEMASCLGDMAVTFASLSTMDFESSLVDSLKKMGKIHANVKMLQSKKSQEDVNMLMDTIEGHLLWIQSIFTTFNVRAQLHGDLMTAEAHLSKREESVKKYQGSAFKRSDKIQSSQRQAEEAEASVSDIRTKYEASGRTLMTELDAYDTLKSSNFLTAIREYIRSMAATQRLVVEEWKSYFIPDPVINSADLEKDDIGAAVSLHRVDSF